MSTDGAVPERWRTKYLTSWHPEQRQLIEELGTAESLVRDLVRALQGMRYRWGKSKWCSDPECLVCQEELAITKKADEALSRIPAHLRAPEATSKETPK